jgi:hypothetical protein
VEVPPLTVEESASLFCKLFSRRFTVRASLALAPVLPSLLACRPCRCAAFVGLALPCAPSTLGVACLLAHALSLASTLLRRPP